MDHNSTQQILLWADGEGMRQIMYLLGVKPKWLSNERVKGFDIIRVSELGRPRIDVTIRVSGITRDNFPMCIELLDEAIQQVAALDEPEEMNFVRKHTLEQMAQNGLDMRSATLRIFCSMPGTYQAGTQLAIYASAWKEEKDLAEVFYTGMDMLTEKDYGVKLNIKNLQTSLKELRFLTIKLSQMNTTFFRSCCYFGTHGGMTAAARHLSGKEVKTYYGDTRNPEHVEVRDLADEIRRVVRTKLLNPKWIEGIKRHGYKGAGDISKRIGRVYGWKATTREVDDWIFDDIAKTFMLNEENRKFFEEHNPWALEEIARRLIEAAERGLWSPAQDIKEALKAVYLEIEGWIEEKNGRDKGRFSRWLNRHCNSRGSRILEEKMQEVIK